jgi:hypothetical protein
MLKRAARSATEREQVKEGDEDEDVGRELEEYM